MVELWYTHTAGKCVCVCVCARACVCTCTLCAPEGPDYMSCREMKSQWIDFLTQCTVFPCGHTHVDVGAASTHMIKDTHTQTKTHTQTHRHTHTHTHTHITHTHTPTFFPADWLSFCLYDFFFSSQQNYQLGRCVPVCACIIVFMLLKLCL